jgi:hypothetical protein
MSVSAVRQIVLLALALALGIALGAVTKFGLGHDLAVAQSAAASPTATR